MNSTWLDINILEAYLNGTLDPKTMHRIEKEALDDPFIAEALEGLSQSSAYSSQTLSLLQKQLQDRIAQQKEIKKTSVITWQRLSIAAAAAVIFISVGIIFMMKQTGNLNQNARTAPQEVEVSLSPLETDSVPDLAANAKPVVSSPVKQKESGPAAVSLSQKALPAPIVKEENTIADREIDKTLSEAKKDALAKNNIQARKLEEIVVQSYGAQQRKSRNISAPAVTALESRVSGITVPTVQGKVISQIDGTPLPGAYVKIPGTKLETITNAKGEFAFYSDTALKVGKVVTGYIGFQSKEVKLNPNQTLAIALIEDINSLNEVVAVGYSKHKPSKAVPVPSSGDDYYNYLKSNNKFYGGNSPDEYVELSFTVSKEGTPVRIKIVKGLEKKYNDEAIRLLTDGPKWTLPKKGSNKVSLKIYF